MLWFLWRNLKLISNFQIRGKHFCCCWNTYSLQRAQSRQICHWLQALLYDFHRFKSIMSSQPPLFLESLISTSNLPKSWKMYLRIRKHIHWITRAHLMTGFRIRCFCLDSDPVFKFFWIRIRLSNFSGSGSDFQISLDLSPVSAPGFLRKKSA